MLSESDVSVSKVLAVFASYGLEVCLLVPTETGMNKSIMDATDDSVDDSIQGVRSYFESRGIHNYSSQPQGTENKVTKSVYYVYADHIEETKASLYRPNTKNGDPRIWFYGLKEYAVPYNLLAILFHQESLYLVNCSDKTIFDSIFISSSPLGKLASYSKPKETDLALELYDKLKNVSSLGYVPTVVAGPPGVGLTLQHLLGIKTDSSPTPDYKGIELKSKRIMKSESRFTLFGKTPNWELSPIGSAWNLLMTYGYIGAGEKWRLAHQMNAVKPNSLDLMLDLDRNNDWLTQNYVDKDNGNTTHILTWQMELLIARLLEKHRETFWVYANRRGQGKNEEFHYIWAKHTKSPIVNNFYSLLETGSIYQDFTMSVKNQQNQTVRDHGYLFKMWSDEVPALIPLLGEYDLTTN